MSAEREARVELEEMSRKGDYVGFMRMEASRKTEYGNGEKNERWP